MVVIDSLLICDCGEVSFNKLLRVVSLEIILRVVLLVVDIENSLLLGYIC